MIDASVIIPSYNYAHNIRNTISAYLEQTVEKKRFELILVDNCSTDNPEKEIEDYIRKGLVKFLKNESNLGTAYSRNRGIDLSEGRIVIFSNVDTIPAGNFIEEHIKFHEMHPRLEYVALGDIRYPQDVNITPLMRLGNIAEAMQRLIPYQIYSWFYFGTGNVSVKKDFIDIKFDIDKFPQVGFEDTEFGYRLAKKGMVMIFNNKAVSYHHHFLTSQDYLTKSYIYGAMFARWMVPCDLETRREINSKYGCFTDMSNLSISQNLKIVLRQLLINRLTADWIMKRAIKFQEKNEEKSFFFYNKLEKYLFKSGYKDEMKKIKRNKKLGRR